MKKYLLIAAAALCLFACQKGTSLKTTFIEEDMVLPLSEELRPDDHLALKYKVEHPVSGASKEILETLDKTIADCVFGYGWEDESCIDSIAVQFTRGLVDEYLGEFLKSVPDTTVKASMTREYSIDAAFLPDWKDYYCYAVTLCNNEGGPHPNNGYITFVFDKKTGKQVEEWDFFKEGYGDPVSKLLEKHIRSDYMTQLKKDGFDLEPLEDTIEQGGIWSNGVYLPGPQGVEWIFQPYEIAPHSYGIITVLVPWSEIKDWVK